METTKSAQPVQPFVTPDEYVVLDRAAEFRSEYISGEMIAMSRASNEHESIVVNIAAAVHTALRGKPCRTRGSNMRVRVRSTNYLYPDLTVVCGKLEILDDSYLDTILDPTVIFEILSDSTEFHDRSIKWQLYQRIEPQALRTSCTENTESRSVHQAVRHRLARPCRRRSKRSG